MTRRSFLAGLAPLPSRRVVVIVADDLGIGDVGCYGAADARTPHLDRMAREGARCTDFHAASPVCSPSRAALLTGKTPQRCGIPQILFSKPEFGAVPGLRAGETTLASLFRARGCRTAAIGKWHLGTAAHSRPRAQGFDEFFGFYSGWIDYYSHRFYTLGGQPVFHDLWRDDAEVFHEPEYQTELLAREAKAFLRRQRAPYFLYVAFGAPHYPMMAPQRYLDRFPATMDRDRRLHLAMVAALDDAVGEIREAAGKDATVFFISDNGATREERADHRGRPYEGGSNRPYRGWKGSLFEGGIRVPALWSGPEVRPGDVDETMCAIDVAPTLTGAGDFDGVDASAVLRDRKKLPERALLWEYDAQRAVRRGRWKLLLSWRPYLNGPLTEEPWLSDLVSDPGETRNVAAAHPDIVRSLRRDWEQRRLA